MLLHILYCCSRGSRSCCSPRRGRGRCGSGGNACCSQPSIPDSPGPPSPSFVAPLPPMYAALGCYNGRCPASVQKHGTTLARMSHHIQYGGNILPRPTRALLWGILRRWRPLFNCGPFGGDEGSNMDLARHARMAVFPAHEAELVAATPARHVGEVLHMHKLRQKTNPRSTTISNSPYAAMPNPTPTHL